MGGIQWLDKRLPKAQGVDEESNQGGSQTIGFHKETKSSPSTRFTLDLQHATIRYLDHGRHSSLPTNNTRHGTKPRIISQTKSQTSDSGITNVPSSIGSGVGGR
ncbi:Uncharacterized protein HZ326_10169 [Fusarium oxysporum f. sp. albedinis]|nr:Uncharacterized protein HZ326_10169 [Fusarium oxysporum f. sp. albedinis]